jgi:hypothetical protein
MFDELSADEMKTFELFGGSPAVLSRLSDLDLQLVVNEKDSEITVKHAGKVLGIHKFSQAPEAHPEGSDSAADQAKSAEALARAKAAVMSMQTRNLVTEILATERE